MQKIQQIILFTGLAVIAAMTLFPPWSYVDDNKVNQPMGYAPLWKPPMEQHQNSANILGFKVQLNLETQKANTIDLGRLAIQYALVGAVTAGALALCKRV
jgi:hypothetical protein